MAFHFIALESVGGRRIAWHYASEEKLDKETLRAFIEKAKGMTGGIHKIQTDSTSWQSVVDRDSYFDGVLVTRDADEFIRKCRLLDRLRYLQRWVDDMIGFTGFYIQRDLADAKREMREIEKELYHRGGVIRKEDGNHDV
ncbi:putative phage-associated protein [Paenibacillus larvae subsp. larvae]|uniref:Phage-associated protein n=6 Tax=root TaxID=1 RepID=A0A345AVL9_9CAUD|nr:MULTISPECIES: hypothetical protein [Bacillales]YP_010082343.1 hypothetical protein KMD18_gp89 [Paenibacillus phage Halcyone]YP_010082434.1 hypothetical protein KMD19_gp90 [Paenibacillus phage Scottie]YP_010082512.1 hypothetical protein KMD20_gp77 [Paenibacillus phage Unity]AXF41043.1 hypothetical protein HEATH_89 [Paenibacillus phage Heath]MEB9745883.1 hypothetical protein [Bacillus cereus]MED2910580.1 hypothetical protein [Bacillus thuringiensis]AQT83249.1 hypothetical protein B1222_0026